jgi:lipopolysaccharide assembly protein B
MQDWLLLLIFFAAIAAGWSLGRWQPFSRSSTAVKRLPDAYFRGLNHLFNEQPERAMELFMQALDDDSEAIETHLALGKLFRARGDLHKATQTHQNLLARSDLESPQRLLIQFELASDYMAAGLLDRAEGLLKELLNSRCEIRGKSLFLLLDVYQREKDWQQAIRVAEALLAVKEGDIPFVIAHYYCELAQGHFDSDEETDARKALMRALDYDGGCVRAYLLLAEIEMVGSHYKSAVKSLKQVKKKNPDYLAEALPMLRNCYGQLGEEKKFHAYLLECLRDGSLIASGFNGSQMMRKLSSNSQQLNQAIHEEVRQTPSLQGLRYLLDLQMYEAEGDDITCLQELREFVAQLIAKTPAYCCEHCGYKAKKLTWCCPSCQRWAAIKPSQVT